ncbi:hypothetical protein BH11PLA2_BH11PLA2_01240 [soil metagenome]
MARMIIQLRADKVTGKQNIIVKLDSDADALPIEHEQLHRKLVEQLVGRGMNAEDLGDIVIEREPATAKKSVPTGEAAQEATPVQQRGS